MLSLACTRRKARPEIATVSSLGCTLTHRDRSICLARPKEWPETECGSRSLYPVPAFRRDGSKQRCFPVTVERCRDYEHRHTVRPLYESGGRSGWRYFCVRWRQTRSYPSTAIPKASRSRPRRYFAMAMPGTLALTGCTSIWNNCLIQHAEDLGALHYEHRRSDSPK